jgi:hypothetical protein
MRQQKLLQNLQNIVFGSVQGNEVLDCTRTLNDLFELNKVQSVLSKNKGCIAPALMQSLKRAGTK